MCLGIPGQVLERVEGYGDQLVLVDVLGAHRQVNIGMLEDEDQALIRPGGWVMIHMGFVVELVDEAGAEKAMSGLELMGRPRETDQERAERELVESMVGPPQ
jgi:hydrogenase expression/formation protein HypC